MARPVTSPAPAIHPQGVYGDKRDNYVDNEVATDYNAGFTGALAAMVNAPTTWAQCDA